MSATISCKEKKNLVFEKNCNKIFIGWEKKMLTSHWLFTSSLYDWMTDWTVDTAALLWVLKAVYFRSISIVYQHCKCDVTSPSYFPNLCLHSVSASVKLKSVAQWPSQGFPCTTTPFEAALLMLLLCWLDTAWKKDGVLGAGELAAS